MIYDSSFLIGTIHAKELSKRLLCWQPWTELKSIMSETISPATTTTTNTSCACAPSAAQPATTAPSQPQPQTAPTPSPAVPRPANKRAPRVRKV